MSTRLNKKITIVEPKPMTNSKASETYVAVRFSYGQSSWEGYVPIEYRRTGVSIDFNDKDVLNEYLNSVYEQMSPEKFEDWKRTQEEFWAGKPKAGTTKAFLTSSLKVVGSAVPAICREIQIRSEGFRI